MYNITGGLDLTLSEVNRVSEVVTGLSDPSCNIIFGAVVDEAYNGELHVTIIATGFAQTFEEQLFKSPASRSRQQVQGQQGEAVAVGAAVEEAAVGAGAGAGAGQKLPWGRPDRSSRPFLGKSIF